VTAVGVAFAAQRVEAVPHDIHDQPLDWIVTEEAALHVAPEPQRRKPT
jgi:5-formyltetrahydrofolate cyclo-ligase